MTAATAPRRTRSDAFTGNDRRVYRCRELPATPELLATLPPSWQPVHRAIRDTTPAWCIRCDKPCRLPFGPGEGLCGPCREGELVDELARLGYVRVEVGG